MDDSNGLEAERHRLLMPTGVSEDDICKKLRSQGAEPDDVNTVLGPGDWPFMGFRKFFAGKWRYFLVPKCVGSDGYLLWQLVFIEETLAKFEIELLPLDRNLH